MEACTELNSQRRQSCWGFYWICLPLLLLAASVAQSQEHLQVPDAKPVVESAIPVTAEAPTQAGSISAKEPVVTAHTAVLQQHLDLEYPDKDLEQHVQFVDIPLVHGRHLAAHHDVTQLVPGTLKSTGQGDSVVIGQATSRPIQDHDVQGTTADGTNLSQSKVPTASTHPSASFEDGESAHAQPVFTDDTCSGGLKSSSKRVSGPQADVQQDAEAAPSSTDVNRAQPQDAAPTRRVPIKIPLPDEYTWDTSEASVRQSGHSKGPSTQASGQPGASETHVDASTGAGSHIHGQRNSHTASAGSSQSRMSSTQDVVADIQHGMDTSERRINLASAADGASIVAANKEARKPEKTIDSDDDSYMKNLCSAHKWFIVELSQLGRVDEVMLMNKEMYSSRVREWSLKGRQSHPRKDSTPPDYPRFFDTDNWQLLGNFSAQNRKGSQNFKVAQPRRVRYLLFQFHTHYGSEEVCALNSLSVLGVSAAQELEEALSRHLEPATATHPAASVVMDRSHAASNPIPGHATTNTTGAPCVDQEVQPGTGDAQHVTPGTADAGNASVVHSTGAAGDNSTANSQQQHDGPGARADGLNQDAAYQTEYETHVYEYDIHDTLDAAYHAAYQPSLITDANGNSDSDSHATVEVNGLHTEKRLHGGNKDAPAPNPTDHVPGSGVTRAWPSRSSDAAAHGVKGANVHFEDDAGLSEINQEDPVLDYQSNIVHIISDDDSDMDSDTSGCTGADANTDAVRTADDVAAAPVPDQPISQKPMTCNSHAKSGSTAQANGVPAGQPELVTATPTQPPHSPVHDAHQVAKDHGHGPSTTHATATPTTPSKVTPPPTTASHTPSQTQVPPPKAAHNVVPEGVVHSSGTAPVIPGSSHVHVPAKASGHTLDPVTGTRIPYTIPTPAAEHVGPSLLDSVLAAMDGGPAAKPRPAGNLFDLFKQEFVMLRLNQSRTWKYMSNLVEVLNINAGQTTSEIHTLEQQVQDLKRKLAVMPSQIEASMMAKVDARISARLAGITDQISDLRDEIRCGKQREWALLLYCSCLVAVVMVLLLPRVASGPASADLPYSAASSGQCSPATSPRSETPVPTNKHSGMWSGSRLLLKIFFRMILLVGIFNGFLGVVLQNPDAQQALAVLLQRHLQGISPDWAEKLRMALAAGAFANCK